MLHYLSSQQRQHTHTHPFNGPFSGTTQARKVKPIWILLKQETVSGSGISWDTCKSAPHSRQITTPALHCSVFYRPDALPAAQPTASKHWRHTHPFNSPLSRTTWVSWYQKSKINLDFTEARDSAWQWHQMGLMQVCTSLQTDNHASTPPLSFYCVMLCIHSTSHGPVSVRMSQRSTKTAKHRMTQTTLHDSRGTLVFWCQRPPWNSTEVTPYGGRPMQVEWVKIGDFDK